jgi:hypothetical protein
MKKILALAILLNCIVAVHAQSSNPVVKAHKGGFGVKAGLNLSNLSGGYSSGELLKAPAHRLGPVLGVFYNLPLSAKLSFQPELSYSAEGANQDGVIGASNSYVLVYEEKYKFLNLPLMLQYNPGRFYLEAGPQIGFLLSAKEKNNHPGTGNPEEYDIKSSLKGTSFSLDFGAGYYFGSHFGIGARYALGLTELRSISGNGVKSNVLSLSALYKF